MRRYRFEAILAGVFVVLYVAFSCWQSAPKLTQAEVDAYVRTLERHLPKEMEDRAEFIARLRAWGERDDGNPVYMLNLMRFYDRLHAFPGVPATGSPREANAYYESVVLPMLLKGGGYLLVGGDSTRVRGGRPESNLIVYKRELDNWDRVLVVRYAGRRSFLDLVGNPEYLKVMPYKLASLEVVLTPVSGELVIPDLRWLVGSGLGTLFLLIGWIRAVRVR